MGVMTKLRSSTKYILWILVFSFGLLWMLADTKVFDAISAGPRSLGNVNGSEITIEEYNQRISYFIDQYSNRTGNSVTPEMRATFEKRAWDELVATKLMEQKMADLGIQVTDQELADMVTGDNPVDFIKQQFQREDGTIDRAALRNAIEAPENTELWIMIEQQLRQQRRQQKLTNYLQAGLQVSDQEVAEAYERQNSYVDVSFVRFPYADVKDEELDVTEEDLRDYYNDNEEQFERKESYRFEYVSFSKKPTAEDTVRTQEEMRELRSRFANTSNDSLFMVREQSATPYNESYVAKSELRDEFQPVLELDSGEVTGPIQIDGRIHLLKMIDERGDEVKFRNLSRDIIADPIATVDAQAEVADDFSFFAEEQGFETEAERRNLTVSTAFATKGNSFISGLGRSQQIMNYLDRADEGDISTAIELNDQFVVIHITEITPAGTRPFGEVKGQIESIVKTDARKALLSSRVEEYLAANATLDAIAEAGGKEVQSVQDLSMDATAIKGAGREPEVIGAFFGLETGEMSGLIEGNNAIFVAKPDAKSMASAEDIDATSRSQIRQRIQRNKQQTFLGVWVEELKEEADITDNRDRLLQ